MFHIVFVKVNKVIYWVDNKLPNLGERYLDYIHKNVTIWGIIAEKDALPYCDIIVVQSSPVLEGIPVISLDMALITAHKINPDLSEYDKGRWYGIIEGYNSNPNQYTEKDIKNILCSYQVYCQLKYNTGTVPDALEWFANHEEQINSIQVIEVDVQFNILSYE
jgi:hypothetical protein